MGRLSLPCFVVVHLRGREVYRQLEMHCVSCLTPQQDDMHDYLIDFDLQKCVRECVREGEVQRGGGIAAPPIIQ